MTISAPPSYPQLPPPPSAPPPPPDKPRPRRGGFVAAVMAGALLVGGGAGLGGAAAWSALEGDGAASGSGTTTAPLQVADSSDSSASGSVEQVAKKVLPSVVALDVSSGGSAGSGSGIVLTQDGLILTNDHVVTLAGAVDPDTAEVKVSFNDGTTTTADVVGTDPLTDTALVQAQDVSGLTPVTIGQSGDLEVGEQVVAIGSPYGLDSTVTSGIVSALNRPVEVARDQNGNTTAYPAIQTDAAINHGNSGGALVNMAGQLVGINASIRSDGNSPDGGSIGIGFAIPIDEVTPIIEQLRNGETPTHARLGIEVGDDDNGAVVRSIEDGSAAAEAGLRTGDVITRIDDHPVDSAGSLVATVRSYRPDDRVTVTFVRDGDQQTTQLSLGSDAS